MAKFKKINSSSVFIPVEYDVKKNEMKEFERKNGERVKFRTRKAVEKFCVTNRCHYLEVKRVAHKITHLN